MYGLAKPMMDGYQGLPGINNCTLMSGPVGYVLTVVSLVAYIMLLVLLMVVLAAAARYLWKKAGK